MMESHARGKPSCLVAGNRFPTNGACSACRVRLLRSRHLYCMEDSLTSFGRSPGSAGEASDV